MDRLGAVRVATAGALIAAVLMPFLGLVGSAGLLALIWTSAGLASTLVWAGLNTLMVRAAPANRAGAVSLVGAFKFTGNAIAPLVLLPIYEERVWVAFAAGGVLSAAIAGTVRRAA